MPRLLVHVEGSTEEAFVSQLLADHLMQVGFSSVSARLVGNPRLRARRGGIRSWQSVRGDIVRHLRQDNGAVATLMVDYYGLPRNWPGRSEAPQRSTSSSKAECVEAGLLTAVSAEMGQGFDRRRFVPHVTMHEFEGLLFSDPERFAEVIGKANLAAAFREIRDGFECPEDINDSVETAPSKRIEKLCPEYQKPLSGVIAALEVGLSAIRA
jgi:hypothetical protein